MALAATGTAGRDMVARETIQPADKENVPLIRISSKHASSEYEQSR
jgi:hypothetical protein